MKPRIEQWLFAVLAILVLAPAQAGRAGEAKPKLPQSVQHLPQARALHRRALQGEADAQALLGDYCYSVADYTQAVLWYQKAAAQGDVGAKLSMACCYKLGRGVDKNLATAEQWYRQALLPCSPPGNPDPPLEIPLEKAEPPPTPPAPPRSNQVEAPVSPVSMEANRDKAHSPPLPAAADQPGHVLVSAKACGKRITTLQKPMSLLLDVPVSHQPYR